MYSILGDKIFTIPGDKADDLIKETLSSNPEIKTYDEIRDAVKDAIARQNELDEQKKTNQDKVAVAPKEKESKQPAQKRAIWLHPSVVEWIKNLNSIDKPAIIDQLNAFLNPDYIPRDRKRFEICDEIAEIKTVNNGAPRLYASKQITPCMMIFRAGNKNDQKHTPVKELSRIFRQRYDSAKNVTSQLETVAPGAVTADLNCTAYVDNKAIHFTETFYRFDADDTQRRLGILSEKEADTVKPSDMLGITKDSIREMPKDASFKPVFDDNGEQLPTFYDDFQLSNDSAVSTKNKFDAATSLLNQRDAEHEKTKANNVITRLFGGKGSHDK